MNSDLLSILFLFIFPCLNFIIITIIPTPMPEYCHSCEITRYKLNELMQQY